MSKILNMLMAFVMSFGISGSNVNPSDIPENSNFEVHFIDVGQADSALIECDGETMMIDGGNVADSNVVAAYLKKEDVTELNYVVCSHAHEDHVGGLSGALSVTKADNIYAPKTETNTKAYKNFKKKAEEQNVEITGIKNKVDESNGNTLDEEKIKKQESSNFTGNIKEINGIKVAFLGYTYGLSNENEITDEEKKSANIYSEELAQKDIEYAKQNSNYIIAIMHWGDVNSSEISEYQRNITAFLVENGVDMILGSHPSVVEPMEIIQTEEGKNVLVAYSLGNYISTLKYANADVELILNIQIAKSSDSDKAVLQKVDYTPIYVLDNGTKAENRFELTDMKKLAQDYANGDTSRISRKTYDSIISKLEKLQSTVNSK